MSEQKMNNKRPLWQRISIWAGVIFVGLIVLTLILQALGIVDTQEEREATQTAEAIALANLPTPIPPPSTETSTPTNTSPPSETPIPSATLPPSETPIPSVTPTITNTPPPTPTPGLETRAEDALADTFGRSREVEFVLVNERVVTIRFPLTDLSAGSARFEAETRFVELACRLRDEQGLSGRAYQITGTIRLVDNFGNTSPGEGAELILPAETVAQINCDNQVMVDLYSIAERFDVHPALR